MEKYINSFLIIVQHIVQVGRHVLVPKKNKLELIFFSTLLLF